MTTPRVAIIMQGGVVQNVVCDVAIDFVVINHDTDGASDSALVSIPRSDGSLAPVEVRTIASTEDRCQVEAIYRAAAARLAGWFAAKAQALWETFTPNERHGVRFGMFPHEKMKVAGSGHYASSALAVELIRCSEREKSGRV